MGKIYEALQQAKKEQQGLGTLPEIHSAHTTAISSSNTQEISPRRAMIDLYNKLDSFLPHIHQKIIQFMSSQEGEGVSTIISEFAKVSVFEFNKSVLILDANKNNPSQHTLFGIRAEYGWMDVMDNGKPIEQAIYQVKDSKLYVSPVSQYPTITTNGFHSPMLKEFLETMRQQFDFILIDAPAATLSSDGIFTSRYVDGVVLIFEADKTRWPVAENVKNQIIQSGGNVLGIVFNKRRYYIPEFIYKQLLK